MQKINWWHALWLSFYSRAFYQGVARQWRGSGCIFLLAITALVVMPLAMNLRHQFQNFLNEDFGVYLEQVPEITVTDGIAKTPENKPYIINKLDSDQPFAVIDTTGKYTGIDQTSAAILVTAHDVTIRNEFQIRSFSFKTMNDMTIDHVAIDEFVRWLARYVIPLAYPFMVVLAWSWRITQAMFYAFIAKYLAKRKGFTMKYKGFMRLSAAALAPAMVIDMLLSVTGLGLPLAGILFVIIEVVYLRFAIDSVALLPHAPDQEDSSISA